MEVRGPIPAGLSTSPGSVCPGKGAGFGEPTGKNPRGREGCGESSQKKQHLQRSAGIFNAIVPPCALCEPWAAVTSGTDGPSGLGWDMGG